MLNQIIAVLGIPRVESEPKGLGIMSVFDPKPPSVFDPNHPLSSDFSDPRQILERRRGQTRPGFLGSRRQNFMGRPLNFSASRRKWLLMAIDTRASDRGPQGTTTPGPLRMIFQGRCVRQTWRRHTAIVILREGQGLSSPSRLCGDLYGVLADRQFYLIIQCLLAETEGFEPSVRVNPVRRFSKPLVSATHPRLQTCAARAL